MTSRSFPKSCLLTLYNAFFHAHLSYAILFWSTAGTVILNSIRALQKRALRIIAGIPCYYLINTESVLTTASRLNVLVLDDFVLFVTYMFMFDIFYNRFPVNITRLFTKLSSLSHTHYVNTRFRDCNFKMFHCRTNICHNFVTHNGVIKWNALPIELKCIKSRVIFKRSVKSYILSLHNLEFDLH
jgi:hypothetical protein